MVAKAITIREGQAILTLRLSPSAFAAFEAYRQTKSDEAGAEVSRNALGRFLIEQQLHVEGALDQTAPLTKSKQRVSMKTRLEQLEAEVAAMKKVATGAATPVPWFE